MEVEVERDRPLALADSSPSVPDLSSPSADLPSPSPGFSPMMMGDLAKIRQEGGSAAKIMESVIVLEHSGRLSDVLPIKQVVESPSAPEGEQEDDKLRRASSETPPSPLRRTSDMKSGGSVLSELSKLKEKIVEAAPPGYEDDELKELKPGKSKKFEEADVDESETERSISRNPASPPLSPVADKSASGIPKSSSKEFSSKSKELSKSKSKDSDEKSKSKDFSEVKLRVDQKSLEPSKPSQEAEALMLKSPSPLSGTLSKVAGPPAGLHKMTLTRDELFQQSILRTTDQTRIHGQPYCGHCRKYLDLTHKDDVIIKSGFLMKKKNVIQRRKKRYVVLLQDHLIYYIRPEDVGNTFPKGVVHLTGAEVIDKSPDDPTFILEVRGKKLNLRATNISEKIGWISSLKSLSRDRVASAFSDTGFMGSTMMISPKDLITERGYSCQECKRFVDLDAFNLADYCGWAEKYQSKKRAWKRRWVVVAEGHLAYFASEDDVRRYKPLNMVHVSAKKSTVEGFFNGKEWTICVRTSSRPFYLALPSKEEQEELLSALKTGPLSL